MPRSYTLATAALALQVPIKWLDNALSHHKVVGVHQEKQGVARRLTIDALVRLAVATILVRELGIPLPTAIEIAEAVTHSDGHFTSSSGLRLELDLKTLRTTLLTRLEHAVEIAPIPRQIVPVKPTSIRTPSSRSLQLDLSDLRQCRILLRRLPQGI